MEIKDFIERTGEYSYFIIAFLSFLFGLLSVLLVEKIKKKIEKITLSKYF